MSPASPWPEDSDATWYWGFNETPRQARRLQPFTLSIGEPYIDKIGVRTLRVVPGLGMVDGKPQHHLTALSLLIHHPGDTSNEGGRAADEE
ncbi:hypothetical protein SAMD00023353_1200250 [Rosellinia necatrix]|uniref:Uncharacterized protein n=1 Tax=Rosellinia necatrix TaxID=77044 RepID=A0A1S8A6L1_ROSNE|nr:hypothetical protein SAMD00023353_1200250 [Rosellinia necatrix]